MPTPTTPESGASPEPVISAAATKLLPHVGHAIECVTYGDPAVNVAIECVDCNVVLTDEDLADTTPAVQFGDYVVTGKHGHSGRVTEVHSFCPQGPAWIQSQRVPVTAAELDERWVSILIRDNGGAAVTPMSDCEVVAPFDLNNLNASRYARAWGADRVVSSTDKRGTP